MRFEIISIISIFLVWYLISAGLGFTPFISETYSTTTEKLVLGESGFASSNAGFSFNIFKELVKEAGNKNIFFSPFSVSSALSMAYNGAEGSTKDAVARTLKFENMALKNINTEYLNLINNLEGADEKVEINIANSMWISDKFESEVRQDFKNRVKDYYKSEAFIRNFGSYGTVDEINNWIKDKTKGKIDKMVGEIKPLQVMFLINAIYFKGEWVKKFDEAATKKDDFFLSDGSIIKVNMMSTSGRFNYFEEEDFKAARFPYGKDRVAMYIFLPKENASLDSFIKTLNREKWDEYVNKFQPVYDLEVKLPKFKIEYGTKRLNGVLTKLGMGVAFSVNNANFKGISSRQIYIDYIDHKAVIEVDEEGTEAAAATVAGFKSRGMEISRPKPTFFVNKPFFFVIRDDMSGSILFMGVITEPNRA